MSRGKSAIRKQIVGTDLAAVTFARDYVQLDFDGPKFNVMTPIAVSSPSGNAITDDDQFRNRLCDQIGNVVGDSKIMEREFLSIEFTDGSSIRASIRDEHYPGPEAVVFYGRESMFVVI